MSSGEQRVAAEKSGKKTGRCQGTIVEFPQFGSVGLQSPPQGNADTLLRKKGPADGKIVLDFLPPGAYPMGTGQCGLDLRWLPRQKSQRQRREGRRRRDPMRNRRKNQ